MDEEKQTPIEPRSTEPENPLPSSGPLGAPASLPAIGPENPIQSRGLTPGTSRANTDDALTRDQPRKPTIDPDQLKIVVRVALAETQPGGSPKPIVEVSAVPVLNPQPSQDAADLQPPATLRASEGEARAEAEPQQIP